MSDEDKKDGKRPVHNYRMKYTLIPEMGSFPSDQADELGDYDGLTDALVVISCLYPKDGSYGQQVYTLDARTGEQKPMDAGDIFKAWLLLASALADNPDLVEHKRLHAKMTVDVYFQARERVAQMRAKTTKPEPS